MEIFFVLEGIISIVILVAFFGLARDVADSRRLQRYNFYLSEIAQYRACKHAGDKGPSSKAAHHLRNAFFSRVYNSKGGIVSAELGYMRKMHEKDFKAMEIDFPEIIK